MNRGGVHGPCCGTQELRWPLAVLFRHGIIFMGVGGGGGLLAIAMVVGTRDRHMASLSSPSHQCLRSSQRHQHQCQSKLRRRQKWLATTLMAMVAVSGQPSIVGSCHAGSRDTLEDTRVVRGASAQTYRLPKFGRLMGHTGRVCLFGSRRWSVRA
jgi:hypothetical protein